MRATVSAGAQISAFDYLKLGSSCSLRSFARVGEA